MTAQHKARASAHLTWRHECNAHKHTSF